MEAIQDGTAPVERAGESSSSKRGAAFDAKREVYEWAKDALARMIDAPDQTISVVEYRANLADAKEFVQYANGAMLEAWCAA